MMQHKLTLFKTYDKCANAKPKLTVVLIHGILQILAHTILP